MLIKILEFQMASKEASKTLS